MAFNQSNVEDVYPLGPMQEGMLFHSLFESEGEPPLLQWTCQIQRLDVAAFQNAWSSAVERHAVLRTAFVTEEVAEPLQVALRRVEIPWQILDLRELRAEDQAMRIERHVRSDRAAPFDLMKPPLMRFTLLRLRDDTYVFSWTFHLLLLDGWSTATVLNEVFVAYEALAKGQVPVSEPVRRFRDYIAWCRQRDKTRSESFWRETFAGISAATPLPGERVASGSGGGFDQIALRFPAATAAAVQGFARQNRLTFSTLARAAWALLLSRYSGSPIVVFGAALSGRPPELRGVESIVGLLINTLPVRVDVPEDEGVLPWLQRLQEEQVRLLEHESSRLVDVQGWTDVPRGRPLFESVLVVQTFPIDKELSARQERLGISGRESFERTNVPLTVQVTPGSEMSVSIGFDRDRFAAETVRGLLVHYRNVLEQLVEPGSRQVSGLSLLSEAERTKIVGAWNATEVALPAMPTLPALFEKQAELSPVAPAVVFEGETVDYGELNTRANRLASFLRKRGVRSDVLVGVFAERSVEMVVALLGILKAGGAYVPLDPEYPVRRVEFMLEDTRAPIVLTQRHLAEKLPTGSFETFLLDEDWPQLANESPANPDEGPSPEDLAYVIYTSGSTGKPKGVAIEHRGISNRLLWMQDAYRLTPEDRILQKTPFSFDVSVWEFFWPLLNGAGLVVAPPGEHRDPARLAERIEREKVTIAHFVPPMLRVFLEEIGRGRCRSLRRVICSGEALPWDLQQRFFELMDAKLDNLYGPTEASVDVTYWACDPSDPGPTVPIGRPIANTQIYILDRGLRPVPVGASGDLWIGGVGLAREYLNRPELTAEKFRVNPFRDAPGARIYRSGDLARFRPDGNVEFLGRSDDQVKIRGFRIELGEIEEEIRRQPGIRACVVVVREESGEKRLVAYAVASPPGAASSPAVLRSALLKSLPDYMVPTAFVFLEQLPLTPNGKLDRKALPSPEPATAGEGAAAPHTPTEEVLVGIWSEVLKVDPIGIDDNFFELGGHSLLATQVFSRIRDYFHITLPLRNLFDRPTVRALADRIEAARSSEPEAKPSALRRAPEGPAPLSFAQQRLWFLDQLQPGQSRYNASRAYRLVGPLAVDALREAVRALTERHEPLRTNFPSEEGKPVQVVLPAGPELVVTDLSGRADAEDEAARRVREASSEPFDLQRGPLFRAALFRLGPESHVVLLSLHHIVSDGWSFGVLLRELQELYAAFAAGAPFPLSPLPARYRDHAYSEREWLKGDVLDRQLAYWTNDLKDIPPVLELRADRPRTAARSGSGLARAFSVSPETRSRLSLLSRREGITLYMALIAAFGALLGRQTGEEQILIGSPLSGRNRVETEGLIGLFINTVVVRVDLRGRPSFRELLRRVRESALGAHAHQEMPFERLVDSLKIPRSLSHNPLFQVWFVLQNAERDPLELPGLSVCPLALESSGIRHDVQLSMSESDGSLEGRFDCAADLFEAKSVERLADDFRALLEKSLAQPDVPLAALGAQIDEERRAIEEEDQQATEKESIEKLKAIRRRAVRL